jgi:hypothetical protein
VDFSTNALFELSQSPAPENALSDLKSRSQAVRPYTYEEMRRIMIVENMTQRGYENFGAVVDSVAAVIEAIVRECFLLQNYGVKNKRAEQESRMVIVAVVLAVAFFGWGKPV